jgi:hypothetical protein
LPRKALKRRLAAEEKQEQSRNPGALFAAGEMATGKEWRRFTGRCRGAYQYEGDEAIRLKQWPGSPSTNVSALTNSVRIPREIRHPYARDF